MIDFRDWKVYIGWLPSEYEHETSIFLYATTKSQNIENASTKKKCIIVRVLQLNNVTNLRTCLEINMNENRMLDG
jgi:hypothetical protein